MTRILLTGGTGTLGRLVMPLLRDAGCTVRVLSRHVHEPGNDIEFVTGDLSTGAGVDAAVAGADTVVHCAGGPSGDGAKARHLVDAAAAARVRHLVFISVVGADRVAVRTPIDRALFGYFASKRDAERVVAGSEVGWTTLRATQFHDLVLLTAQALTKLPLVPVATGFRFQPVDTMDVASRLVELALADPAGLVPDIAGPRVYGMDALLRSYLDAVGRRRRFLPIRLPGGAARAIRNGANLARDRAVGRRSWEDFLDARLR